MEATAVSRFDEIDFFTDLSLVNDPYPYFDHLRAKGPITRLPHRNVVAVTGHEEAQVILNDAATFSSANGVSGPIPDLPFTPEGDDIRAQLDAHREEMLAYGSIVTMDAPQHARSRSLLMRLFTPSRLKANEEYMWNLAHRQIDGFIDKGRFELIKEYASPYAMLVIADLLGVPEQDRQTFRDQQFTLSQRIEGEDDAKQGNVEFFGFVFNYFGEYLTERRENPRNDILSELATAKYPDGTLPEISDVIWVAAFLFGAGQDTTARLLSAALQVLGERPDLQALLRRERDRIPDFIEEVLRMDGPVKCASRLAVRSTRVAGVDIPAGTCVSLFYGGCNRDPRKFESPNEFRLGRPNVREHLAFGRGAHTCAGAALARAEVRASLNRLLDRLADIRIDESQHGPADARRYEHEPVYILRGLRRLHLEFTPAAGA
ncbi:MAG TPA: cytochrome P450 [Nevskiaceae bacterium]|nr:cytochrome P450 [Nevskiaceae bacterium]